jgi:hypothetical protein
MKQHEIEVENEQLIDRLINIARSDRAEVAVGGCYSRYNKVERPFRELSPYRL